MKIRVEDIILTLAVLLMTAQAASAVSIGAGPSNLDFGKMVRGGYAEQSVTVGTSGDENLTCTVEYTGNTKDWVSTDKGTGFILPANGRVDLKIIMQPKPDTANGGYDGAVYIKAAPTSLIESGAGLAVGAGVKIRVTVEITGKEEVSLNVENVVVDDTEIGYPIKIKTLLTNNGNIMIKPNITSDIIDATGSKIISGEYADTPVLPTREETIPFTLPSKGMSTGQYNALVNVYAQDQLMYNKVVPFKILPKGTLSVSGQLVDVSLNTETPSIGEVVKITGKFKNMGQVTIDVKLKSEVYFNDKLADVKESDSMEVDPGSTVLLDTYYTPTKEGNHILKVQALFNNIQTEQKTMVVTVGSEGLISSGIISPDIIIVAVAILLLLVVIILKSRKKQPQYYYPPPQQPYPGYYQQAPPTPPMPPPPPAPPSPQAPPTSPPAPPQTPPPADGGGQTTPPNKPT